MSPSLKVEVLSQEYLHPLGGGRRRSRKVMQRLFSPMLAIYGLHVNCPYEISISIWTKKSVIVGCYLPFLIFWFQLSLIWSVSSLFCILCHFEGFFLISLFIWPLSGRLPGKFARCLAM